MHLFPIFIAALLLAITVVGTIFWRRWLVAVWIFSVLVLPLIRFHLGAPIYIMDVLSVLMLWQMVGRGGRLLPFRVMPWPWLFMGLAFASTVASGFLLFGFHPEQLWIWGHYSLSCLPLAFATVIRNDSDDYYTLPLITGLTASLVILAVIGIIQHFDLPGREQIRDLFYSGFDSSRDVAQVVERMWENKDTEVARAPGPHFSPGAFGGITLLGCLALILIQRGNYNFCTYLGVLSTVSVALTRVTRLVLVAAAAGAVVFLLLSSHRQRLKAFAILSIAGLIGAIFLGSYFSDAWSTRLGRWNHGVMEDDNVLARAIDGPTRLVNFFTAHPETLVLGAGPDPEKLESKIQQESSFESGFVSNSFLLAFYYMGAIGFLCYTWFWWKVFKSSLNAPGNIRGAFAGAAVVCGIIIAADNYAMMFEAAATILNLIAGLVLSERIFDARESQLMGEQEDCEELEEAHGT